MIEPVFEEERKILEAVCGVCGLKVPVKDDFFWQAEGLASLFDAEGGSSASGSKFYSHNFLWTRSPLVRDEIQVCDVCIERMLSDGKIVPDGSYLD